MLRVLEEATQENGYYGGFRMSFWLMMKSRLAQLYRKMGRVEDADKIEAELLSLLRCADLDHPILVQLQLVQRK